LNDIGGAGRNMQTGQPWQQTRQEDNTKMRRRLYTSNYTGIPAYLMDFGFGGFLGYGRRVSCCVGEEELKMYEG
jgi:hypothetical protein